MDGYVRHELVMGTMVAIQITDPMAESDAAAMAEAFFCWMHEVDRRFSTHKADSEVCRLDRGEVKLEDCSPYLREVLDACADLWPRTDGYFDVYATGKLDPSGYVKGWSAEVASARLAEAGCTNHFINAGGDIRVRGYASPGVPWHIPVRHPWQHDGLYLMLACTDLAVATSGTYERGFHVVNPHTGEPAEMMRSVTVVGPDLAVADAYATTAVAMGEPGLAWLATLDGYESAVVTEDGRVQFGEPADGLPDGRRGGPVGQLTRPQATIRSLRAAATVPARTPAGQLGHLLQPGPDIRTGIHPSTMFGEDRATQDHCGDRQYRGRFNAAGRPEARDARLGG
jgi:thiamine biosynthesis lipoprotein